MSRAHPNERQGRFAEERVAEIYGLEHTPDEAEWYDCVDPSTGAKYEVKSTHEELDSGAPGRFRLWADQHRSLAAAQGSGTAWYAFVLLSSSGDVLEVQRRRPSTVTGIVDGTWNRAGHADRDGPQHKLEWPAVIDR